MSAYQQSVLSLQFVILVGEYLNIKPYLHCHKRTEWKSSVSNTCEPMQPFILLQLNSA